VTLPGPFTLTQQAVNEHYAERRDLALAFADAVNEEARDLVAAGADVVQLDEPWLQARPEEARGYALEAIERALDGIAAETALHTCFGYAHVVHDKPAGYPFLAELNGCAAAQISLEAAQPRLDPRILRALPDKTIALGVLDLGDPEVESPQAVAARIRAALEHVEPERLVVAPDCGMKYLPRETARGKLLALVEGAALVRSTLSTRREL
jgi:5-methyltetrahydropteroyltriglutamate--homocysteine methyltransferase